METVEKMEPDFTVVHGAEMRGNEFSLKQGVQTGCKEKIFPCEDKEQVTRAVVQSPALEYSRSKFLKL